MNCLPGAARISACIRWPTTGRLKTLKPRFSSERGGAAALRRVLAATLCLVAIGLLFYEWKRDNPPDPALIRLENEKTLIFGINPDFPPFATIQNDQVVGLDADIAREVAQRLGATTAFRVLGFDGLYDALRVGDADLLISGLISDPARLGDVRYSIPYFDTGPVILSLLPRPLYPQMAALEGATLAVEIGSSGDEVARLWARRLHNLAIRPMDSADAALGLLKAGQADAILVDQVTARMFQRALPALQISAPVQAMPLVIAARRTSIVLMERVNAALRAMTTDGTLTRILAHWFQPDPP